MPGLITHETMPVSLMPGPVALAVSSLDAAEARAFARELTAAFRRHPHVNNVMTHVALGRWQGIEDALVAIFSEPADVAALSPLSRNILDLLWAEAGVTGRILKPLFLDFCRRHLSPSRAEGCVQGIAFLFAQASAPSNLRQAMARRA